MIVFCKIYRKYLAVILAAVLVFSMTPLAGEAAGSRLENILARGTIDVATEPYFAPNEFIDPSKQGDARYVGSDIEFAKYIAGKLGVKLRIVPVEFSAVLIGVTEGKYDLAISSLAYTPARAQAMNLSKGYYFSKSDQGHGLLVRKTDLPSVTGPESCAGKVVVAQSGSLQELFVNEQIPSYKEFKRVSSTPDGFLMVQEKKADVCVTSKKTAELYIAANKECGLALVPNFTFAQDEETLGTRIGIPPGETELTERINQIVDEVVKNGVYEKWYDEYSEYAASLGL
ncbi:amino acid ABC transporter substrate-binding protein [Synergistales bacterium]|nr:amino acid ABC transporter substrate-binding protein [Synergistales bacterium]